MQCVEFYCERSFMSSLVFENIGQIDLRAVFNCGQCFRWTEEANGIYSGVAGGRFVRVRAEDGVLWIDGARQEDRAFWYTYFDLDRDYEAIKQQLTGIDRFLDCAIAFGGGLRILNQEFFETVISFILSANNNIPRIRGCVEQAAVYYGRDLGGHFAFPDCRQLCSATEEELSERLHAGYRCRYIVHTCRQLRENPVTVKALQAMSLQGARRALCSYMGVGNKVADCILLFTGARQDVFPVDVWVKRIMEELYFKRTASVKEVDAFAAEHFGKMRGFAQQYLFYYAREHMEELRNMI